MTFSTIVNNGFVTLRVEGNYCPIEIEPHGERVEEHFEDVAVYVVGHGMCEGDDEDITDMLSDKQHAECEAILMQEWRDR